MGVVSLIERGFAFDVAELAGCDTAGLSGQLEAMECSEAVWGSNVMADVL
ncbi:MAG: hypothetical protein P4L53_06360 [Candidatus Obscuribacterales bacterium]|nr:hypothetical protein [Candidatus Obscuribacterales bacterium]